MQRPFPQLKGTRKYVAMSNSKTPYSESFENLRVKSGDCSDNSEPLIITEKLLGTKLSFITHGRKFLNEIA